MPCSKRMEQCKMSCRHRQMVEDYRMARLSATSSEEERTAEGRGERELEAQNYVEPPICFKQWLMGYREQQD